jgi:hypothetical protein
MADWNQYQIDSDEEVPNINNLEPSQNEADFSYSSRKIKLPRRLPDNFTRETKPLKMQSTPTHAQQTKSANEASPPSGSDDENTKKQVPT